MQAVTTPVVEPAFGICEQRVQVSPEQRLPISVRGAVAVELDEDVIGTALNVNTGGDPAIESVGAVPETVREIGVIHSQAWPNPFPSKVRAKRPLNQ